MTASTKDCAATEDKQRGEGEEGEKVALKIQKTRRKGPGL